MNDPTRPVANLQAFIDPVCLQATYRSLPKGIEIVGNGTVPNPLDVRLSGAYAAAPDLLAALRQIIEFDALTHDQECRGMKIIARAAINKATGAA